MERGPTLTRQDSMSGRRGVQWRALPSAQSSWPASLLARRQLPKRAICSSASISFSKYTGPPCGQARPVQARAARQAGQRMHARRKHHASTYEAASGASVTPQSKAIIRGVASKLHVGASRRCSCRALWAPQHLLACTLWRKPPGVGAGAGCDPNP